MQWEAILWMQYFCHVVYHTWNNEVILSSSGCRVLYQRGVRRDTHAYIHTHSPMHSHKYTHILSQHSQIFIHARVCAPNIKKNHTYLGSSVLAVLGGMGLLPSLIGWPKVGSSPYLITEWDEVSENCWPHPTLWRFVSDWHSALDTSWLKTEAPRSKAISDAALVTSLRGALPG